MPNPIEVEQKFTQLLEELDSSLSLVNKWKSIAEFFELIREDISSYDTYCLQLVPQLPVFRDPLSVTGCDPEFFEQLLKLSDDISRKIASIQEEHFRKARQSLVCSFLFLYACLGELDKGIQSLQDYIPSLKKVKLERDDTLAFINKNLEKSKEQGNEELTKSLHQLKSWWTSILERRTELVYVPVVGEQANVESSGRLRELQSRIIGGQKERDLYESYYAVFGAEKAESGSKKTLAQTVRRLIDQVHTNHTSQYCHLQFSYKQKWGLEEGRSSELASGLSAFCTISNSIGDRKKFNAADSLALTGSLGKDGKVEQIDQNTIRQKAKAAFFSWIQTLVVPASQKQTFEVMISEFVEEYPNKDFSIIGINRFEEVIYDRRITIREIDSLPAFYFNKAWSHRYRVSGMVTILMLLVVIGAMWYGPIDENPVIGIYKGEQLHIQNKNGKFLEAIDVNSKTVRIAEQPQTSNIVNVSFADITGDGRNEIFWATQFEDDSHSTIKVKELGADTLLWSYPVIYELNFPKKEKILPSSFQIGKIQIVDFEGDNHPELIASFNHSPFFPGILSIIDAKTGKERSHLVSPGHIYDFELADIDEDSVLEVVFGGVSNSFDSAFLAAVNHNKIKGMLPYNKDYVVRDYGSVELVNFVTIPPTILGQSIISKIRSNRVVRIDVIPDKKLIEAEVNDTRSPINNGIEEIYAYLKYFFDYNFKVSNIGTSDAYDATADLFYKKGLINQIPSRSYFEAFQDSLLYWDEDEFVRGKESIPKTD